MDNETKSPQFFENLLFPKIFRTFRIAVQPSNLIIAFLALAVICLAGKIMDLNKTVVVRNNGDTELQIYMNNPGQLQSFIERNKETSRRAGVFSTMWIFAAARFQGAVDSLLDFKPLDTAKNIADYFKAVGWAVRYHLLYSIIFFAIKLTVIAITGGSLCRTAALQLAQGEKPGLTETLRYSTKKFLSFVTAPLAPLGIIISIGLFIFLLGLIGNIPWLGELVIGIFAPLALAAGTLIAVVSIGTVAGFNLMFPAIAYDGSDCFDAISRAFSYIFAKPWRMVFYTALAAVYGAICYIFVRAFAFLLLLATRWFLQLGVWAKNSQHTNKLTAIWPEPYFNSLVARPDLAATNLSQDIAAIIIYLCVLVVVGLVVAFIISFYFSANTIIYSLMRNRVDGTALEDVYTPFAEVETESLTTESEPEENQPDSSSEDQQ